MLFYGGINLLGGFFMYPNYKIGVDGSGQISYTSYSLIITKDISQNGFSNAIRIGIERALSDVKEGRVSTYNQVFGSDQT